MSDQIAPVLLIEYINADQFPGQVCATFPFIQGFLNGRDGERVCRWVRFALDTSHFYRHRSDAVNLAAAELEKLRRLIDEHAPGLIITTHPLAAEQQEQLLCSRGDVTVISTSELEEALQRGDDGLAALEGFEGIAELDRPGFAPDHRWEPGNEQASRRDRNNIYLLTSRRCGYVKPVTSNACYADVELPQPMDGGCAFCCARVNPRQRDGREYRDIWVGPSPTPEKWLSRQVQAVADSLGDSGLPNALLLEDVGGPQQLTAVVRAMEAADMTGTVRLLVGIRVDRLLQIAGWLRDELSRGSLPGIHVFSCGLESFSAEELGRLNKGSTPLQNLRAVNLLRELELQYPGRFLCSSYRGLSMILFTPWTTLGELHLNARLLQHLELEETVGNAFVSRLRLHPDLAITALARHDGVIVDDEADEALRLNRRKLFGAELPWRHRDPLVAPVSRLARRLDLDSSLEDDDELYSRVQQTLGAPEGRRRRQHAVAALVALVEAALEARPDVPTDTELIDRAGQALAARAAAAADRKRSPRLRRLGEERLPLDVYMDRVTRLVSARLKPVASVEQLTAAEVDQLDLPALEARGFHCALREEPTLGTETSHTLFIAQQRLELLAMLKLQDRLIGSSAAERAAAIHAAGRLFGYPSCCARKHSEAPHGHVATALAWQLLSFRNATPGEVPVGFQPLLAGALSFVPCSLHCEMAALTFTAWQRELDLATPTEQRLLLFPLATDAEDELVSVVVLSHDAESLTYDPASLAAGSGPLRNTLARGDALRFVPGQIQLLRHGEPMALWTAAVGLWFSRRSWHDAEWRELARSAIRSADPTTRATALLAETAGQTVTAEPEPTSD